MSKGLTLIELLVVTTIIGILSSVLFLGSRGEEKKLALQRSAFQLIQDLREVQGMTMGAEEIGCNGGGTYSFGINFDTTLTSYYLFADCPTTDQKYNKNNDKLLREVKLEKEVEINNLKIQELSTSTLDIVFFPPDPTTHINQIEWGTEGVITLSLKSDPSQQKTVKINSAGRIEIE